MRLALFFASLLLLAGCGSGGSDTSGKEDDGSVIVDLPDFQGPENPNAVDGNLADTGPLGPPTNLDVPKAPLPKAEAPAPEPTEAGAAAPEPPTKVKAKAPLSEEPAAASTSEESSASKSDAASADEPPLLSARPPLSDATIAQTLKRMGHNCGEVTAANRVDSGNIPGPIYKITCSSGSSYQGTTRRGRLFFRQWTGKLTR